MEKKIIEFFRNLQPFEDEQNIPDIPKVSSEIYTQEIIPNLIRCGAIPKSQLIEGKTYIGSCRNTSKAVWNGSCFEYDRYKFGTTYLDHINHFEDDDGYDLFVPIQEEYSTTWELCPECENEVELENIFKVQYCPVCGKKILPCSICTDMNCKNCPLEDETNTYNT